MCHNGDVLIVFSAAKQMLLHSEILMRHCDFFRAEFSKHPPSDVSSGARKAGVTQKWRFDLEVHHTSNGGTFGDVGQLKFTVGCYLKTSPWFLTNGIGS
jgi:hypothetical protein